jgi:hypothetical protein
MGAFINAGMGSSDMDKCIAEVKSFSGSSDGGWGGR